MRLRNPAQLPKLIVDLATRSAASSSEHSGSTAVVKALPKIKQRSDQRQLESRSGNVVSFLDRKKPQHPENVGGKAR